MFPYQSRSLCRTNEVPFPNRSCDHTKLCFGSINQCFCHADSSNENSMVYLKIFTSTCIHHCTIIIEYDDEDKFIYAICECCSCCLVLQIGFSTNPFFLLVSVIKLDSMVSLKGICQWWKWWYIKYTDTTVVKFYIIPNLCTY